MSSTGNEGVSPTSFRTLIIDEIQPLNSMSHKRDIVLRGAVITVSTTRTQETDTSGQEIMRSLTAAGIPIVHYCIVPDQIEAIRESLFRFLPDVTFIVMTGGTGLTPDDCTIEAIEPLFDKKIDGFGEFFRQKSLSEIGTSAMLSRAIAGIIHKKAVFCLPGSHSAVKLATNDLIIPEIGHILSHSLR